MKHVDLQEINLSAVGRLTEPPRAFEGCSFRGRTFKGVEWSEVQFRGCDFSGAIFDSDCRIHRCEFSVLQRDGGRPLLGTILDGVEFDCELRGAHFHGARLDGVSFLKSSWLAGGNLLIQGGSEGRGTVFGDLPEGTQFVEVHLVQASFRGLVAKQLQFNGRKCLLEECVFDGVRFENVTFDQARLLRCSFRRTALGARFLGAADLSGSDFEGADWTRASLENVIVDGTRLWPCRGLTGRHQATLMNIQGAERATYSRNLADEILSWSWIRKLGSLPLFGVSYFALAGICLWASAVHWTNEQLTRLRGIDKVVEFAPWVVHIDHLPTGTRAALTLAAIVCLAFGATIYRFTCPSEIQENTETDWTFRLRNERMRYLALATTRPTARYCAGALYGVGAAYLLFEFSLRIGWSFYYLWPGV